MAIASPTEIEESSFCFLASSYASVPREPAESIARLKRNEASKALSVLHYGP